MNNLDILTSSEIGTLIDAKQIELRNWLENIETLEEKKFHYDKSILKLEFKRREILEAIKKARHIRNTIQLDITRLTRRYWDAKRGGL